jgi:hypothetical protein
MKIDLTIVLVLGALIGFIMGMQADRKFPNGIPVETRAEAPAAVDPDWAYMF